MLRIFKNKIVEDIKSISSQVQDLIYVRYSDNQEFSEGLLDGEGIIKEYIESNEKGLAFEHLLYMISESKLEIPTLLLNRIYKIGVQLGISRRDIDDETGGLTMMGLQNKTSPRRGVATNYWFENEHIGLPQTLFHRIEIPLTPFNSGLDYEPQPVETTIIIDWLKLNLKDTTDLDGISLGAQKGSYEEVSIYLGCAHNPCDINRLSIRRIKNNEYTLECELYVNFEHEGVAKNEIYTFEVIIDFIKEIVN